MVAVMSEPLKHGSEYVDHTLNTFVQVEFPRPHRFKFNGFGVKGFLEGHIVHRAGFSVHILYVRFLIIGPILATGGSKVCWCILCEQTL